MQPTVPEAGGEPSTVVTPVAPRPQPKIPGYEITGGLGVGGMGMVYRAVQVSTGRAVALKVMSLSGAWTRTGEKFFRREIRLAATLEHPNIARVYDAGVTEGTWYYSMQLIDGTHLDRYVADRKLDANGILRLMQRICEAVGHAHRRGIVHRDLKPSNILVAADGTPFLVDFGLAKCTLETESRTNPTGAVMAGTIGYVSPEIVEGHGEDLSPEADVYALGVILYRLLTGSMPYEEAGGAAAVLRRISTGDIIPPRHRGTDLPAPLVAIIYKSLAHEPRRRHPTALHLADDLKDYLREEEAGRAADGEVHRPRIRHHHPRVSVGWRRVVDHPAFPAGMGLLGAAAVLFALSRTPLAAMAGKAADAMGSLPLGVRAGAWIVFAALLPWIAKGLALRVRAAKSNLASAGLLAGHLAADVLIAWGLGLWGDAARNVMAAIILGAACAAYTFWSCERIASDR